MKVMPNLLQLEVERKKWIFLKEGIKEVGKEKITYIGFQFYISLLYNIFKHPTEGVSRG